MKLDKVDIALGISVITLTALNLICWLMIIKYVAKMKQKTQKNSAVNISFAVSIISLFIFSIPLGIVAFILAIIAITKDQPNGGWALLLSILCPIVGTVLGIIFLGALLS